ncbi:TMEM175 family protein [Herbiconiux sp. 11R-BC]|uniref:TMEM175 family protein n=1 Tax=Herbiconiux sp. 11R-BC TaxID=3111637 RepID=UPI003C063122
MRLQPATKMVRIGRLEMFSDGAFAIIITLLVLEIHRPSGEPGQLGGELIREWPSYLAYAVAFVYIGVIWLNHHYVFSLLSHTDLSLQWINFGIVGTSALIPFPTGVLAGAFASDNLDDQKSAVLLYAGIAFLMSISWIPLFLYLRRNPATLKHAQASNHFTIEIIRPAAGAAGYILAAVLGWFVAPIAAVVIFVLIVIYYAATSTGLSAGVRGTSEVQLSDS